MQKTTYSQEQIQMIKNAAKIELAKRDFFYFCNTLASDFYLENRKYLRVLCKILQALYEGRIIKIIPSTKWKIVNTKEELKQYNNYRVCKKLMLNMPPQHRKIKNTCKFLLLGIWKKSK